MRQDTASLSANTSPSLPTHCVIYRTGGTENFRWHRTLPASQAEAIEQCAEVRRMGYASMVEEYDISCRIGLPDTFDAKTPYNYIND